MSFRGQGLITSSRELTATMYIFALSFPTFDYFLLMFVSDQLVLTIQIKMLDFRFFSFFSCSSIFILTFPLLDSLPVWISFIFCVHWRRTFEGMEKRIKGISQFTFKRYFVFFSFFTNEIRNHSNIAKVCSWHFYNFLCSFLNPFSSCYILYV